MKAYRVLDTETMTITTVWLPDSGEAATCIHPCEDGSLVAGGLYQVADFFNWEYCEIRLGDGSAHFYASFRFEPACFMYEFPL